MSRIIIEGITEEGELFHPRNWMDRLSASVAAFGPDHRLRYSHYVQPQTVSGKRCLVVERELAQRNPDAFRFLVDFANRNRLRIREDDSLPPENAA